MALAALAMRWRGHCFSIPKTPNSGIQAGGLASHFQSEQSEALLSFYEVGGQSSWEPATLEVVAATRAQGRQAQTPESGPQIISRQTVQSEYH